MKKRLLGALLASCMVFSSVAVGTFSSQAKTIESASVSAVADAEATSSDYGLSESIQDGQILQCFNWSYTNIKNNMAKIAEQGFTAVQTSPIQPIKESTQGKTQEGSWWVNYQPVDFKIDDSSQNALGTKADFKAMCDEAHKYGVKVVVDAVLNHMANKTRNNLSDAIIPDIRDDSNCWYSITENTTNWSDRFNITHRCMDGLPDLNTSNKKIQTYAINFLKECIDAGTDGFRFDGAKHIETPGDASGTASDFWPNVLNATTSYAKSTKGFTPYYYGEILDKTGGVAITAYTQYISITDNKTADDIRGDVNSGNASGAATSYLSKGAAPNKTVLWNESHDTYQSGASSGVSKTNINKTWAIVGARSQICGMYLARPSNFNGQKIGESSTGTGWDSAEVKAINQFDNYFDGQGEYLSSSGSIAYNERGTSGVVLVNCGGGTSTKVEVAAHKMASGTYTDQISGSTFTVANGKISGNIGSTGIAVVYNAKPIENVSVTPGSQGGNTNYKTDTYTLTLKATNATNAQYAIDNGSFASFTDGKTITIGSGVAYDTVTKVTVKADNIGPYTYSYTKIDPSKTQKIYFDNSSYNWSGVYAYIYSGTTLQNSAWPGVAMTRDSATGYYVVEVSDELSNGLVIFTESETATTNRYPADMEDGLSIGGNTMLFSANNSWAPYTVNPTTSTTATTATTATVATTQNPTTATTTQPVGNVLIGDVNLSGSVSISDATDVQLYISYNKTLSSDARVAADVNKDSVVNIKDATYIQYYLIGKTVSDSYCGQYTGGDIPTQPTTTPVTNPVTQPVTQPTGNYVYFKNNDNWSSPTAYYWSTSNESMTVWPGVAMTSVGSGVYRVEVPDGTTSIIFSNNGSNQTADLTLPGMNQIYDNGKWSIYGNVDPTSATSATTATGNYIYYKNSNNWSTPTAYYWSDENAAMTVWPGVAMTSVGNGVYRVEVPAGTKYIIFSDNGSNQTSDLTIPGMNQIYDNNWSAYQG